MPPVKQSPLQSCQGASFFSAVSRPTSPEIFEIKLAT
jgi:hypothetical protein